MRSNEVDYDSMQIINNSFNTEYTISVKIDKFFLRSAQFSAVQIVDIFKKISNHIMQRLGSAIPHASILWKFSQVQLPM